MKIHTLAAKNFLSLQDCTISSLSAHLNFFVGPNGSGKTSLFRAMRELIEAFEAVGTGSGKTFDHLYNIRANPKQIDIEVKVSWDTEEERNALCAFLYASLIPPNLLAEGLRSSQKLSKLSTYQITTEKYELFSDWLREQWTLEKLQFLFTGQLHLTYREDSGLRLSYTFVCKNEPVTILMGVSSFQDGTFLRGPVPPFPTGGQRGSLVLLEFLLSESESLDKDAAEAMANTYFAYTGSEKPEELDIEAFLLNLADKHGYVQVESPVSTLQAYKPEYVFLTKLSGIDFTQSTSARLSCSRVFALLLRAACVFTNSVFAPFLKPIPFEVEKVFPVRKEPRDEQDIPSWLFGLMSGDTLEKKRYERIQQLFNELTGKDLTREGRAFDIAVTTVVQYTQSIRSKVPMIDILVTDVIGTISMASQGSGVWEALVLSVFLESNEGRVILLDEPAASLHRNMQHRLVEVLRGVPGQVFIVTHSGHLLPTHADELKHIYRFQRGRKGTQVFAGGAVLLTELQKIENKLASSLNFENLLFANGVLLVEGSTEVGAFSVWFPRTEGNAGKTLADLNVALYGMGSKENFPLCLRYLMAFGIPCAAIGDGDALMPTFINKHGKEGKNSSFSALWKVLQEHCPTITIPQESDPFEVYKQEAALAGFYTYDTDEPIAFEGISEVKAYLQSYEQDKQKVDTVYEARCLAESTSDVVPPLVNAILNQALTWLKDQGDAPYWESSRSHTKNYEKHREG